MQQRSGRIWVVVLALLAFSVRAASAQDCQAQTGLVFATVDSGGQPRDLHLDLMLPAASAAPAPLLIWVHGGGWSTGSETPIPDGAAGLCPLGWAVASVEYRYSTEALWPAQIQDVKGAVRWLRANAAQYGIDPDRFAVWGNSAGGQLASMLATAGGVGQVTVGSETVDLEGGVGGNAGVSSRVQALVDWYGATDFLQMRFYPTPAVADHDGASSAESKLLGGPIQGRPARAATANPITFVTPDDPPTLLMHGTTDKLYAFNQSELLYDALLAAGIDATLVPVVNGGHGGTLFETAASRQVVYDFLARVLSSPARPLVSIQASDAAASETGLAGGGAGMFTVSRTGDTGAALTVHLVPGGSARAGADYTAPATLTLPAGAAAATVAVTPADDLLAEGDETITLAPASNPAYRIAAAHAEATVILADDDEGALPVIEVTASDGSAAETGPDPGLLTVTRTGGTAADLTVRYTVAGTAAPGSDYAVLSGEVLIPAGAGSATVPVVPVDDDLGLAEFAETVLVTLEAGHDYALGARRSAGVAIAPHSPGRPTVSVMALDRTAAEPGSGGSFSVTRTGSTSQPLTVTLTPSGSAAPGTDYTAPPSSVTFAAGAYSVTVAVSPLDDFTTEPTETVRLAVAADPAIARGPYAGSRVELADDDVAGLPVLASLAVSPAAVTGGVSATGTVTLSQPAPAGGSAVTLASASSGVAKVPASVTVAAGATTATFTVTTFPVAAAATVNLTASYRGGSRTAAITVNPPALSGLTLTPSKVAGGCGASAGKVTLTGKAPAGGIAVALASADPAASVPASVTVPSGSSSASFTVATTAVSASVNAVISAAISSQGGVTRSATLTVRPIIPQSLALSPNPVTGPAQVTGTVTLECAAAPGDVVVGITSTSNSVARPDVASVVIPAGGTTATFTVSAADVAAVSTASIRASANGTTRSVTLTVNP